MATFTEKLFNMLEEPSIRDHIYWNEDGQSFVVANSNRFACLVLPNHFKHSNFVSFVRQLNLFVTSLTYSYGFRKTNRSYHRRDTVSLEERLAKPQEFSHPAFRRDRRDLIGNIRRKSKAKLVNAKPIKRKYTQMDSDDSADSEDFSDSESELSSKAYRQRKANQLAQLRTSTTCPKPAQKVDYLKAEYLTPPISPPSPKLDVDLLVQNQSLLQSNITNLETRLSNSLREIQSISSKFENAFNMLVRSEDKPAYPVPVMAGPPRYSEHYLPPHPRANNPYRVYSLPAPPLPTFELKSQHNFQNFGQALLKKQEVFKKQEPCRSLKIGNLLNPMK